VDENLSDDQQAEVVRRWLRDNGAFLALGVAGALGGLFGWQQWQGYERGEAEKASELYEEIVAAIGGARVEQAEVVFAELSAQHPGSTYVDQARLVLARSLMDRSDFDAAGEQLEAVVSHSDAAQLRQVASVRLARVLLQQRRFDEALAALDRTADPSSAFAPRYEEVRGDVYYAQERFDEARAAYRAALSSEQRQPAIIDRIYVQAKLDALGGAGEPEGGESEAADEPAS
jgi:predicted negative regulator of RcsB-dependent stress response